MSFNLYNIHHSFICHFTAISNKCFTNLFLKKMSQEQKFYRFNWQLFQLLNIFIVRSNFSSIWPNCSLTMYKSNTSLISKPVEDQWMISSSTAFSSIFSTFFILAQWHWVFFLSLLSQITETQIVPFHTAHFLKPFGLAHMYLRVNLNVKFWLCFLGTLR